MNIGFVFARGGSKGIPQKNVLKLGKKNLLERSIGALRSLNYIEHVFVSSDDPHILDVASKSKADVIVRPERLSGDEAPEFDAWKHAIRHVKASLGVDRFVFLSAPTTCPFRDKKDLERIVEVQKRNNQDLAIGVVKSARSPFFNQFEIDNAGILRLPLMGKSTATRRQDTPELWDATTAGYCLDSNLIEASSSLDQINIRPAYVSEMCRIDLDTLEDVKMAQLIYRGMNQREKNNFESFSGVED